MSNAKRGVIATLAGLLSFRVVLALVVSTTVTSSVTAPMAYQAHKARNEQPGIAAPGASTTTTLPDAPVVVDNPTVAPTTSTTTTTAQPGQPGVSTTTTTLPTPDSPITADGLFASNRADHTGAIALEGATIARRVWVFFDGENAVSVKFWIDDPTGSGPPTITAETPFDLATGGFDFDTLEPGEHSVLAEVTAVGDTFRRLATFTVIDAG